MEYITKVLIITIIVLVMVVSFFGYQIYQLNNNLSILKADLLNIGALISSTTYGPSQQSSVNSNETQFSQPLTTYTTPSVQNQSTEQSGQQSGSGGGGGGGQGGQGGGGSQSAFQNPITSALLPDPSTLLPVILRTSIIALLVFVIVKWLGGKGIGQLSPFGLLIIVGLGSAIGDPMIYNEVSIPQAMMAVIIAIVFFKIIDYLTLKSKTFRESVEPNPILLVDHGQIDKRGLDKAKMDKGEFEIEMRLAGIEDVNEIKFSHLEPNGRISFILRKKERTET